MVAESIVDYLDAELADTKNTDLFLGSQREEPDNQTVVKDESAPALDESDAFQIDTAGAQVLVRNVDYFAARDKAIEIHKKIAGFRLGKFAASGPWIRQTHITTPPASIGQDERDRHEWSIHYTFEYESTGNENRSST